MNIRRLLIFATVGLMTLVLDSCKTGISGLNDNGDVKKIKFEEAPESFLPGARFKNISCIQLEMTEESVLGEVKKIVPVEDKLIVLTKDYEVKIFDRETGKYIGDVGMIGEGPEEYLSAHAMAYDPKGRKIIIYDRVGNSFVSYRVDGSFVDKHRGDSSYAWMESMESNSEGSLLMCNNLAYGSNAQKYAYTLLNGEGETINFDPFAPVSVSDYMVAFAQKPMTASGEVFKFIKFQTDSLFSIDNGKIGPLLKLDFGMEIPSKETVVSMGQYQDDEYLKYCLNNKKLIGIDKIYETEDLMIFIPVLQNLTGVYFWLDKKDQAGYRVASSAELLPEFEKILEGKTIKYIIGASENEFISCINAYPASQIFAESLSNENLHSIFPEKVVTAIRNIDPEGNPFLLIYSN